MIRKNDAKLITFCKSETYIYISDAEMSGSDTISVRKQHKNKLNLYTNPVWIVKAY
jgi:hypothetical protein